MSRACFACEGSPAQGACEQGQCAAMEQVRREEAERRAWEDAEMARQYSKHPHG